MNIAKGSDFQSPYSGSPGRTYHAFCHARIPSALPTYIEKPSVVRRLAPIRD